MGGGIFLVERVTALFVLSENEPSGSGHDIITLFLNLHRPNQFVTLQGCLCQRHTHRGRVRHSVYGYIRRDNQGISNNVSLVLVPCL